MGSDIQHFWPHEHRPDYFRLEELVDPEAFEALGERAWLCLDPRLLVTLDALRARLGPVVVNTWADGGQHQSRGFRSAANPVGARYSQHRFGRAADMHFTEVTVEEVRQDILQNPQRISYLHITAVELGVSWLHIDLRPWDRRRGLFTFRPQ